MKQTDKIKQLPLDQCLSMWSVFRQKRDFHSTGKELWYLTVKDRESIIEKTLALAKDKRLYILCEELGQIDEVGF